MFFSKELNLIDSLTTSDVEEYIRYFFPESRVISFKIIPEGYENILIKVKCENAFYILRISSMKKNHNMSSYSEKLIKRELDFIKYLQKNGVPVPTFYKSVADGKTYVKTESKSHVRFITLMNYIKGVHPEYTKDNLQEIANKQVIFHNISIQFQTDYIENDEEYSAMSHRMISPSKLRTEQFPTRLYETMKEIYLDVRFELERYYKNTNKQMIHSDIKRDNIFFNQGKLVAFIDFGDIRYSVIAEDLGCFIWDLCDRVYDENGDFAHLVKKYLDDYQKYNQNFKKEDQRMAINYAIDRYSIINLHYLVENQGDNERLKYQVNKASKQLEIVKQLLDLRDTQFPYEKKASSC
ncbi:phosphotransferase [Bacillus cereus]|uniref:phosphotransferase n=1 Tax=Bacillus cereus TaxID=1396 RepID=UPI002AC11BE2|nr:phosphotransferase [Bacillus cereus]MDZ4619140.1 phosphotransferase [Bacillus cereus]